MARPPSCWSCAPPPTRVGRQESGCNDGMGRPGIHTLCAQKARAWRISNPSCSGNTRSSFACPAGSELLLQQQQHTLLHQLQDYAAQLTTAGMQQVLPCRAERCMSRRADAAGIRAWSCLPLVLRLSLHSSQRYACALQDQTPSRKKLSRCSMR